MKRPYSVSVRLLSLIGPAFAAMVFLPSQPARAGDLVESTAKELQQRFASGARYVIGKETDDIPHQWCTEIASGNPLLENELVKPYVDLVGISSAKLLDCDYKFPNPGRPGWVIVLAATPQNLAERMVNACNEVAPSQAEACVDKLMDRGDGSVPAGSNSFIYPITGFVREPCGGGENLIGFRHGVTIQYTDGPASHAKLVYCVKTQESADWQRDVGLTFGTFDVFRVGRLGAVTRLEAGVDGEFPEPEAGTLEGLEADPFQRYVRDNEIRAVQTAYDRMMVIKAAIKMGMPVPPRR